MEAGLRKRGFHQVALASPLFTIGGEVAFAQQRTLGKPRCLIAHHGLDERRAMKNIDAAISGAPRSDACLIGAGRGTSAHMGSIALGAPFTPYGVPTRSVTMPKVSARNVSPNGTPGGASPYMMAKSLCTR